MLFLVQNWKFVVIGVLLLSLVGMAAYVKILKGQKEVLESEKNVIVAQLSVSNASIKSLEGSINDQNAAIDKLKTDADEREKTGLVEITKAKVRADNYKKQAEDLLKKKAPQNVTKCDAANSLINEELKSAK